MQIAHDLVWFQFFYYSDMNGQSDNCEFNIIRLHTVFHILLREKV